MNRHFELADPSLLLAYDRQLLLAELVQDLPWLYDLPTGVLSFGDRFQWQAKVP